jgi:hypothetical protein
MTKQQIAIFLESLTNQGAACLVVAASSLAVSVYAWLPFKQHLGVILFPMHLATMAALFSVFFLMAKHHAMAFHIKKLIQVRSPLPSIYWPILFASFVYFLAIFLGGFFYYPHGIDLGPSVNLRVFSSGWLFLSLVGFGFAQWTGLRIKAYQDAT